MITSLNIINRLVFILEKAYVFFEVGIVFLNVIYIFLSNT
jgi:hypothetical protein